MKIIVETPISMKYENITINEKWAGSVFYTTVIFKDDSRRARLWRHYNIGGDNEAWRRMEYREYYNHQWRNRK